MYREGYFKSQEEEDAAWGKIVIEYQDERQRLALLDYKLENIARSFERIAKLLRTDPAAVSFDGFDNGAPITKAIEDWVKTKTEVARLKELLKPWGAKE